ncbi:MAG: PLP-dependent transferase [Rhodospirillales bacterium]|nr:PLP-dependent transferase [Alphaproteobacteria bacterium]MBL6948452.1 PLP-dependent transferase [Rhodospirillales bacterium]
MTQSIQKDRFGNAFAPGLPYAHGRVIRDSRDDHTKLHHAWRHIERRTRDLGPDAVYNLSGLERGYELPENAAGPMTVMDDELAPALLWDRLKSLALDHLGGDAAVHDIMPMNRQTAAVMTAMRVLTEPGASVVGVSVTGSHPCVVRGAAYAGSNFVDTLTIGDFERALKDTENVQVVALTRLAVSYEILGLKDIERIVRLAHDAGAKVLVDDAGGARVGPAVFDQPKTLELGVDVGSTGLDKYGTVGPRIGLLGGTRAIVEKIRAVAFEIGAEARPMIYPGIVHSLEQYDPARVRVLVDAAKQITGALKERLGNRVSETPVIGKLDGEDILEIAMQRGGLSEPPVVPIEALAGLAMLLLRDHGIMTVHFAGLPPGTSALLIKFIPPETLDRFGGADKFADAVDTSLDRLADIIGDEASLRELLYGDP